MSTTVTLETLRVAGQPGARSKVKSQNTQVGGRARDLAEAFRWKDPDNHIQSKTVDGVEWNAPGTYASEWLHRFVTNGSCTFRD